MRFDRLSSLFLSPRLVRGLVVAAMAAVLAPAQAAGDPMRGKQKSEVCAACHGADGNSPTPAFPRIGGQHPDYLLQALLDYKAGKRKNPIMAGMATPLSKKDIADLAAYFSRQQSLRYKYHH